MAEKRKGILDLLFSIEGLFLLIILAFRLAYIREVPLQLSPDESYYWDWSRELSWGYYSKPPMVAWLIAASTHFLGVSEYAVRLPAVLCGIGFLLFVYLLSYDLFGSLSARWCLFTAALVPIFTVYGLLMTIDPPLLFFWTGALYLGWRAYTENRIRDWFFLGIIGGLGLLTKQTMLAFGFFYGIWLLVYHRDRLRSPGPWLTLGLAFLLWLPNLYWNARQDWITFRHTESHFTEEGFFWLGPVRFILEESGVVSPVLFGIFFWASVSLLKRKEWRAEPRLTYLWVLSAWPMVAVLPLSLFRKVNANWPMPFFVAGLILGLAVLFSLRTSPRTKKLLRGIFFMGLLLAFLGTFTLYQLPRFPDKFPSALSGLLFRFYGWKEMAGIVQTYREPGLPLVTDHRYLASALAFYLPDHPRVWVLPRDGHPENQYHLWGFPRGLRGKEVLLIIKGPPPASRVKVLQKLTYQKISLPGGRFLRFAVYKARIKP